MKKLYFKIKEYYKDKSNLIRHILFTVIIGLSFIFIWLPIIIIIALIIVFIAFLIFNSKFIKQAQGNGIIYGGRGKGKGLLLNYLIHKDKTNPYCNVPYGKSTTLDNISEYLNSIKPLSIDDFVNGGFEHIEKFEKFEGRNVYIDDINVYLPNWADSLLKKKYDSMPPMLAINRHLYNAHMVITTQDRERPYKILKELQTDFSIKAIKTVGWGFIWNCVPILNNFVYTKYIYHELPKAVDMLPFEAKGVVNEAIKGGILTAGQATKEVYEATNGKIAYGRVLQLKKHVKYDTRYFHKIVYGKEANKN